MIEPTPFKYPICRKFPCSTCKYLNKTKKFTSHSTKRTYITNLKTQPNCHLTNLVYLLTCKTCHIQYVGETKRPLESRIKEHLADIKHNRDKPVSRHMNTHTNKGIDYQIIHLIHMNPSDSSSTKIRREKEMYWIHQLRTIYPRGLNNKDDVQVYQ